MRVENAKIRWSETVWMALIVIGAGAAALAGCSSDDKAGAGDSCGSTADCQSGLLCRGGVCRNPGTNGDTGTDDADNGEMVSEEDYLISFVETDEEANPRVRQLKVHNTKTEQTKVVTPDSIGNCNGRACYVSGNYEYFFASEGAGGETTLDRWEIGSDLTATGSGSTFIENVRDVRVLNNHVQYQRGDPQGEQEGFVKPASGGQITKVATIQADDTVLAAPEHDRSVVFEPYGRGKLDVKLGNLTQRNQVITFDGTNWDDGIYFDQDYTAAFSPDGKRLTYISSAPENYGVCQRTDPQEPYSGCEGVAMKCGSDQRCSRYEITAHIIDMQHRGELGDQCEFNDDCSGVHECYYPGDSQADKARCIPQRIALGVPESIQQNMKGGCELVRQDPDIDFTSVSGPITYDDKGRPYLAGTADRSCVQEFGEDEPVGQVIRLNPSSGDYSYIDGIPNDEPINLQSCVSAASDEVTPDTCKPYVRAAHASPSGDEVAYIGMNPKISTKGFATSRVHVWHALRDRSDRWFLGDPDNFRKTVSTFDVHSIP